MKNAWLTLFISLLLTSCGHVHLKDAEWCGDMGASGAACFHTFSAGARELLKDPWDAERFGMLCTKAQNFADWKASILQLCSQTKNCTHDEIEAVKKIADHAAGIAAQVKE